MFDSATACPVLKHNRQRTVQIQGGVSYQELKLAGQLIDTLSAKFDPSKFHDDYQANVQRLIEQSRRANASP